MEFIKWTIGVILSFPSIGKVTCQIHNGILKALSDQVRV